MLLGAVFVACWAWRSGIRLRPRRAEYWPLAGLGLLFTVQIALLNSASPLTSPSYGVVILNTYAIFTNLAGHVAARYSNGKISEEALTPVRTLGLALAIAGVAWLVLSRPDQALAPRPLLGNLLMVASAVLLGIRQVYTRWLVQKTEPVRSVVWQMAFSVPLFLASAVAAEPPLLKELTWEAVAAISYQGLIVAGICFIAWARLLQRHASGTLSMFSFLVPVFGILLSGVIFGEQPGKALLGGTALVLTGVFVVIRLGQGRD
jgi:drug/metabolite transporter (DMT)-like permease